jgi:Zn-dependent peptidase ImmA (M78 family)/transcriptional regulator with XRE-family HTH domain
VRRQLVSGVTPAVLKWARESANMSLKEVASRLKKTPELVQTWETGEEAPSYSQLETLAYEIYKRPVAMFFLPFPPEEPRPQAEFRSLPDAELGHLARETILLIRKARAFQAALIELYQNRNPISHPIWRHIQASPRKSVAHQAAHVRQALGVSVKDIFQQPDADAALKLWRRAIEQAGIHVFKDSFKQEELSGFCLWHNEFPVILINNSTTKTRQVFSLLHEMAHVLFDRSAISRFDNRGIDELPAQDRTIEQFCNALAGEILVPMANFAEDVREYGQEKATDAQFEELAKKYHVSRSVILRRFVDRGEASVDFYLEKDRIWADQRKKEKGGGGSYYNTQGVYLSENFLREVVSRYSRRLLTKNEAAELIGVKPRNFERFEDLVLRGQAA